MTKTSVPAPESEEPVHLADWAEAELLASGRSYLTRTHLRTGLRDALFLEEPDELALLVESIFQEVARRQQSAPEAYPFAAASRIERRGDVAPLAYDFCLCLTVSDGFREAGEGQRAAVLFEHLILDALRVFLGPDSDGVRFGWPPEEERPGGFPEALDWLAEQIGLKRGPARARTARNDGGVDVVVWRSFSDDRPGHVVILGQGTVARRWSGKERDVIADEWRGFLDFLKDPLLAFGLPCVVRPNDRDFWEELSRSVNLVLDRMRLLELASESPLGQRDAIAEWTEREVGRMQAP